MHMEHAKAVLDACYLKQGQHVLMASGRAARVAEIGKSTIRFDYLDSGKAEDHVIIPRHRVPEMVRV
ncbi:hypothetical protein DFR38_12026 [Aquitalea magnusonii]|uniref:Uncharacterized protein n=2 Tax=Aquitalea magnusonii TaxID=332411 RepID=A0A318J693_9NEIS|nr:hypothetical protein DFR38_12026 [Aquitalea magnusonii]